MGTMTNERFAQLVATGKLITDYADSGDVMDMEALDEDMGVAMKFENEDDDEADSDADEVKARVPAHTLPSFPHPLPAVCSVPQHHSFFVGARTTRREKAYFRRGHVFTSSNSPRGTEQPMRPSARRSSIAPVPWCDVLG
jgi:hypothetical protein